VVLSPIILIVVTNPAISND